MGLGQSYPSIQSVNLSALRVYGGARSSTISRHGAFPAYRILTNYNHPLGKCACESVGSGAACLADVKVPDTDSC